METGSGMHWLVLIIIVAILAKISRSGGGWTGADWAGQRIVVKDFRISFKPIDFKDKESIDISAPVAGQASDEAIYVAITGRPAGLLNFIREHIGLSRRFEFLITSTQSIQRLGSPSTQILSISRLHGLNSLTVGLIRPLKAAILSLLLSVILIFSANQGEPSSLAVADAQSASAVENNASGSVSESAGETDSTSVASNLEESEKNGSMVNMIWQMPKIIFSVIGVLILGAAPAWFWTIVAMAIAIYAAYLFFVAKLNVVNATEGGVPVVGFIVSPSFLESRSTDIALNDLNKIPMIFKVLKDK